MNAGLYYFCYQLSLCGWNVMPTARNARGVDIIAYNSDATRFIGVQVKGPGGSGPCNNIVPITCQKLTACLAGMIIATRQTSIRVDFTIRNHGPVSGNV